ncbi:MAG: hypothetical protein AAGF20_00710 [Pseudomonadota bacterium]
MTQNNMIERMAEVPFDECPEGLFVFGDYVAVMTEYVTLNARGFSQRDAFIVSSGEYFWGGTSKAEDRSKLMVRPIPEAAIAALLGEDHVVVPREPSEAMVKAGIAHRMAAEKPNIKDTAGTYTAMIEAAGEE